jgi:hypothetical protein
MMLRGGWVYALGRVPVRLLPFRLRIVTEPKELQASGSVPAKERQRAMISPFARATGFPIGK